MKKSLIILLYLISLIQISNAQERWVNTYKDDLDAWREGFAISYDNGYLLSGRHQPNWPRYSYLIKTDVNGEVLWEKTLGDGINGILPWGIGVNDEGSIYFSGSYGVVGAYSNPLIMKLNACGEKEWCWLFPTEGYHDYGYGLTVTPDGGVAFIISLSGNPVYDDRICLARFARDGTFLWKNCYNLPDTVAMDNEIALEVITTPDSGFLLTGFARYSNPEDSVGYFCPYYIKTDFNGEMEWYNVAGFHPYNISGSAYYTTLDPDSNFYYSAIRHNHWNPPAGSSPALLKLNMQGQIVDVYDIVAPHEEAKMQDVKFINDTMIAASAFWGTTNTSQVKAVTLDTIGNIIEQTILLEESEMPSILITDDEKALYYLEYIGDEEFDVYLFKLNQNLESDSLYTQWIEYDSLCPYQITNDTIPIEGCGVIVGTSEISKSANEKFEVFPNPASKSFVVKSAYLENGGILQLINMQGQSLIQENVPSGTTNFEVGVSGLTKGIYLVRFKSDKGKVVSAKLVVER